MRCEERRREPQPEAPAAGWVAFRVDLPDDPPAEVTACPDCVAREFGRTRRE